MRSKFANPIVSFLLLLVFALNLNANARANSGTPALNAVSENSAESAPALAELRAQGPAGLKVLFQVYAKEINEQVSNPTLAVTPEWKRLSAALDAVSQQKDSYLSGLYWYTDFAKAKAAARAAGKPILSLRLLGKLNEEYSCANSRFFRTILYSNAEVSKLLRERFILHWQSERPAPRVTIDFGDGRKLERTLTGNSIHYILDPDGWPLDALPGLYGPAAFLRALGQNEAGFKASAAAGGGKFISFMRTYPSVRLSAINLAWLADTEKIGGKAPEGFVVIRDGNGAPQAIEIAALAMTKSITELSLLQAMTTGSKALGTITDEQAWNKIALLHLADAQLDARSIGLIQRQTQKALTVEGGASAEKTLRALIQKLERNIALDTVRNEYLLHTKLYAWLLTDPSRNDVDKLNRKVYAELFLTPPTDPWLGLFSPDVYTALEGGGISR
ncbi:MAG TPA: hypothetical protein VGO73_00390 [Pyrinomonadaceae bacterium]|jgi:hypothetical protein|nr:hypothetical protein [Pyrinomonadaceae bacterium]